MMILFNKILCFLINVCGICCINLLFIYYINIYIYFFNKSIEYLTDNFKFNTIYTFFLSYMYIYLNKCKYILLFLKYYLKYENYIY